MLYNKDKNTLMAPLKFVYRIARFPLRRMKKLIGRVSHQQRPSYRERRKHYRYYKEVIRIANEFVTSGGSVIDVGAGNTFVLEQLHKYDERIALDHKPIETKTGIESIFCDFLEYNPGKKFDLVLCLQVLEHQNNPHVFAQKLLQLGKAVIISVPYNWPKGFYEPHIQDPVDEKKLEGWTLRKPDKIIIVKDKRERLIAVYIND